MFWRQLRELSLQPHVHAAGDNRYNFTLTYDAKSLEADNAFEVLKIIKQFLDHHFDATFGKTILIVLKLLFVFIFAWLYYNFQISDLLFHRIICRFAHFLN